MKIKVWPVLAFVLLVFSLVIHKLQVAKRDFTNAQKVENSTDQAPLMVAGFQQHTDPAPQVPDQPAISKNEPHGGTTLAFGAGADPHKFPTARAQLSEGEDSTDVANDPGTGQNSGGVLGFIWANLATIVWALIGLIEVIVRLTPSEKDNSLLSNITDILSKIIPNRRAGGGTLS